MQRKHAQSMFGMLMVSSIAWSALAQTAPITGLPPLPTGDPSATAPMNANLPVMPAAQPLPPSNVPNVMSAPPAMPPNSLPASPAAAPTSLPVSPVGVSPALPAVSLPPAASPATTPSAVPSAQLPSLPQTNTSPSLGTIMHDITHTGAVTEMPEASKSYSYGNSSLSILFMPVQIEHMKQAIRTYENTGHSTTTIVAAAPVVNAPAAVAINEPAAYPVFYLASIAYDAPGSWSLWISGHKITSRKNGTDLTVVSVGRESATFTWAPNYIAAINQRHTQQQFASADPVKNRLLRDQPINLNVASGAVTFTLKPNQSFAVGYFKMFEGFIPAPKMPTVTAPAPGNADTSSFAPLAAPSPSGMQSPDMSPPSPSMMSPPNAPQLPPPPTPTN